jgi:hypothetical protein
LKTISGWLDRHIEVLDCAVKDIQRTGIKDSMWVEPTQIAAPTFVMLERHSFTSEFDVLKKHEIESFKQHVICQINKTKRHVTLDVDIPHAEKVFSIFEPHTEWGSKGNASVPVEFGVKVWILEGKHLFILQHQVTEKKTDDQVAVPMVVEKKFSKFEYMQLRQRLLFSRKSNYIERKNW